MLDGVHLHLLCIYIAVVNNTTVQVIDDIKPPSSFIALDDHQCRQDATRLSCLFFQRLWPNCYRYQRFQFYICSFILCAYLLSHSIHSTVFDSFRILITAIVFMFLFLRRFSVQFTCTSLYASIVLAMTSYICAVSRQLSLS